MTKLPPPRFFKGGWVSFFFDMQRRIVFQVFRADPVSKVVSLKRTGIWSGKEPKDIYDDNE